MRTIVAAAVACLSIVSLSHADDARASIRNELSIPPQELVPALRALSRDAQIHLVYLAEDVRGRRTAGVAGTLSIAEALQRILSGTGLTFRYIDEQTISILPVAPLDRNASGEKNVAPSQTPSAAQGMDGARSSGNGGRDATSASDEAASIWSRFRLAQAAETSAAANRSVERSGNASDAKPAIEEIVVTAQKRQERLQDVPISISVLDGDDLDRSTVEGLTEALSRVPGVATMQSLTGGGTRVTVRGVGAGSALFNGSSPISFYLDSVPFALVKSAIVPDTNAYDLERVEVLRGPQGTLYGANAQNGVVRVLTHDADSDDLEFKARTSASGTTGGGENYRGDATLNVPLVKGKLAARGVIGYQNLSGWLDRPTGRDANDAEIRNMRLKVNARPIEPLSIGLSAWASRADYGAPSFGDDQSQNSNLLEEPMSTDFDAYDVKAGYEFSEFSLVSTVSYLDYENAGERDVTAFGLAVPLFFTGIDANVFSGEVILNSKPRDSWKWSLGVMYRDGEDRLRQNNLGGGVPFDYTFGSESYAAFGEISRRFLQDRLEWTLGGRYFQDDVFLTENISQGAPGSAPIHRADSFDSTTPRAVVTWYPNRSVTLYTSYAEGFRSGFEQDPIVIRGVPGFSPVKPDKLRNYEIGAKGDVWDGRLSFDSAVYYIDWRDVQQRLAVAVGGTRTTAQVNGESASGLGIDFGMTARPSNGLGLGINLGWNDLTLDAPIFSATSGGPVLLFAEGDRLSLSPEYTAGAWADYELSISRSGLNGRISASANYTSNQDQSSINSGVRRITVGEPLMIAQTSFSISSPQRWTATLFVDNVTNEDRASMRDTSFNNLGLRVRPRTFGLQLEFAY